MCRGKKVNVSITKKILDCIQNHVPVQQTFLSVCKYIFGQIVKVFSEVAGMKIKSCEKGLNLP